MLFLIKFPTPFWVSTDHESSMRIAEVALICLNSGKKYRLDVRVVPMTIKAVLMYANHNCGEAFVTLFYAIQLV